MSKTIEITLDEHCHTLIRTNVKNGIFSSSSEMIHQALILLEEQQIAKQLLIKDLEDGEKSGMLETWDFDVWLKGKHKEHIG